MTDSQAAELSRAGMMIDLGRFSDAARLLSSTLATSPDSSRGWCLLARAHLGGGQFAEAVAAAARAAALDPADDWPYRLAGTALVELGQTADAVTAALEARRLAPHSWRSQVCLAQAAEADGQLDLGAEAAEAALAIAPYEADAHVTAGKVALGRGDVAEATRRQHAALGIEPEHSGALNELGRISLRSRDPAGAALHFLRAARLSPSNRAFGRNSELALGRIALQAVAAGLLLIATICAVPLAVASHLPLAFVLPLPMPALALAAWTAAQVRRLPPAGRRHLPRLVAHRAATVYRSLGKPIRRKETGPPLAPAPSATSPSATGTTRSRLSPVHKLEFRAPASRRTVSLPVNHTVLAAAHCSSDQHPDPSPAARQPPLASGRRRPTIPHQRLRQAPAIRPRTPGRQVARPGCQQAGCGDAPGSSSSR